MGVIKKTIRNMRFGRKIHAVLAEGECLMYQNVMNCSTNHGKLWWDAVVGLTDRRIIFEWQLSRGKDISMPYEDILGWNITEETGGLIGGLCKILPINLNFVELRINKQLAIVISDEKTDLEIFINQLKNYCP